MQVMRFRCVVFLPDNLACIRMDTEHVAGSTFRIRANQEDLVTPDHGRRVPDARQFRFPVKIFFCPLGRKRFQGADALAIGAVEPGPFLSGYRCGGQDTYQNEENKLRRQALHRSIFLFNRILTVCTVCLILSLSKINPKLRTDR